MTEHTTMTLTRVTISRKGANYYGKTDPAAPFMATIEIESATGKVELNLSEALSRRIVEIVADEVVAAGKATAAIMVADAMLVTTPALESDAP